MRWNSRRQGRFPGGRWGVGVVGVIIYRLFDIPNDVMEKSAMSGGGSVKVGC